MNRNGILLCFQKTDQFAPGSRYLLSTIGFIPGSGPGCASGCQSRSPVVWWNETPITQLEGKFHIRNQQLHNANQRSIPAQLAQEPEQQIKPRWRVINESASYPRAPASSMCVWAITYPSTYLGICSHSSSMWIWMASSSLRDAESYSWKGTWYGNFITPDRDDKIQSWQRAAAVMMVRL